MFFINIFVIFYIVVTKKVTTVKICIKQQKSVIVNHYSAMGLFYRPRNQAFFTQTGVGTLIAEGKEVRNFGGKDYILEQTITTDIALVKAYKADKAGNLVFRKTARNFNPECAMAGKITVAEVEQIVEIGELDPDDIHLPGIYVDRLVLNAAPNKRIEQMTLKAEA